MISKLKIAWKALRGNFWGSLAVDVALMITVFVLISMWQTRNLPDDEHTPPLELAWLDDMRQIRDGPRRNGCRVFFRALVFLLPQEHR